MKSIRARRLLGCYIVLAFGGALIGCRAGEGRSRPVKVDTEFLRDFSETRGYSSGKPASAQPTPNGDAIVFLRSGPRDVVRNLYEFVPASGEVRGLLRAEDLLHGEEEKLSVEEKARRERRRVTAKGFAWYALSEDGEKILVSLSGRLYVVARKDGRSTPLPENDAGPALDAKFSPDGRYVSCIRGSDLYVTDIAAGTETAVTKGGTEDVSHGVAEFVAQEEMDRSAGYWWSGDSKWLAFEECDQREVETLYIADARNPEQKPGAWRYPRAGKANAKVRLGIVSVSGGEPRWVEWDREKYPYMATVRWGKDAPLTVYVQTRDQREGVLYRVEHESGKTRELVMERDAAWLNIDAQVPRWLKDGTEFLWTSERSGAWELELHDRDGKLIKPVAGRAQRFQGLVALDEGRLEVVIEGSDDPTQSQLYRISIDRGDVVALTDGRGSHNGTFSKDGSLWVEGFSLMDGSSRTVVRGRDSSVRGELPSVAEMPPFVPKLELTTVDVGERELHAAVIRPRDFSAGRRYPVIVSVYGGPHSNTVSASSRGYLRQQWMADQGFIVVSVDGRGTPRRGREWERVIAGNLIDVPMEDQVAGLQALGARYREMDLSRVGIYGWSFGGYFSVMAVLKRPDVFHCAVAGAPVIDWRDYDTHYTERYMGLPDENAEGYRVCNALTYADQLERPLLLIHGTTDDNVYFTHTLKMAESLFRAGRPYDLLVLAGFTHMVPEPEVTMRLYERIVRQFQKHLVETAPRPLSLRPAERRAR